MNRPVSHQAHLPCLTLVERTIRAWNHRERAYLQSVFALDYRGTDVCHAGELRGPAAAFHSLEAYWLAFPDWTVQLEDTLGQDERVAVRWRARGTHLALFMQIPPTRRTLHFSGLAWFTVHQTHIAQSHFIWDVAEVLRALRLLPDL